MKIKSLKVAYFSPTGTTKKIIQSIIHGIDENEVESIDITKPDARKQYLQTSDNELLVVAVPVYMGRVPALVSEWLNRIKANNTLVVCVVIYGNRTYGDALLELKDILKQRGCIPIAGAAYIGEHSFSSSEIPIVEGHPNTNDLNHAEIFGRRIKETLETISTLNNIPDLIIPGDYPYGGVTELWSVDFIEISDKCTKQGICAEVCPVGAIDFKNTTVIDNEKCISCCACIKKCPDKARTIKASRVKDAAIRLNQLFIENKNPEIFFVTLTQKQ